VPREHVADFGDAAVGGADDGESLQGEGRPGTIPQEMLEAFEIARHVTVDECDPDTRVYRKPAILPGEHVGSGLRIEEALPWVVVASPDNCDLFRTCRIGMAASSDQVTGG